MTTTREDVLDPRIRNSRIAIIDDQLDDLSSAIAALKAHGFLNLKLIAQVSSLGDLLQDNCDLIVLDILGVLGPDLRANAFAGPDGLAVLRYLKDRDPTVEVIVLTAGRFSVADLPAFQRADASLAKPFQSIALVRLVEELLVRHHSISYQTRRAVENVRDIVLQSSGIPRKAKYQLLRDADRLLVAEGPALRNIEKFLQRAEKYVGSVYYTAKILSMIADLSH